MNSFIEELNAQEQQTVFECLCVAELEEFFPEWEFETLFGISRKQLSDIREKWPKVDPIQPEVGAAVVGAMNHLLGYAHGQNTLWKKYLSVSPNDVQLTLEKLLALGL